VVDSTSIILKSFVTVYFTLEVVLRSSPAHIAQTYYQFYHTIVGNFLHSASTLDNILLPPSLAFDSICWP